MNDCQKFEKRIQFLMDSRIDPETDQELCDHTVVCEPCYESMMAFSLLHTNYLQDSDSMKIKLENLGLHEALFKHEQTKNPNRKHLFALAASLAALVLVMAALTSHFFVDSKPTASVAISHVEPSLPKAKHPVVTNVNFDSFVRIKQSLDNNDIYASISELPGLRPFKTISNYLDWFQRSFFGGDSVPVEVKDVGQIDLDCHNSLNNHLKLALS